MKAFLKPVWMFFFTTAALLFACVTINIYFPAEKVESVAGDIVDDVRNRGQNNDKDQNAAQQNSLLHLMYGVFGPATAWAQEATEVSNATIRALKQKMKERYNHLKPYYAKGVLIEQDTGYLAIREGTDLGLKEKRDLRALVDAENEDRRTLYEAVAEALNIDKSQVDRIAGIFAKEWQK